MVPTQEPSLATLRASSVQTLRQAEGTRPDVLLVRHAGGLAVLKDYSEARGVVRHVLGAFAMRREARALRALEGIAGIPRLLARPSPYAVLISYAEARPTRRLKRGTLTPEFLHELEQLVAAMHARDVAHCDLRSRGNLLVTSEGHPFVVDFASHMRAGARWNVLRRWIFRLFCDADRIAIAQLKLRHAPQLLTDRDRQGLMRYRKTVAERGVRRVARFLRTLARWLLTGRRERPGPQ